MEVENQNSDAIDLTDCEREPIHLLGGIQPQGCLLAIDPTSWQVVQWSINLPAILGIPKESLAGLSIAELIEPEAFQTLQQVADSRVEGVSRTFSMQWLQKSRAERHLAAAHLFQDILILEVEIAKLSDIPFIATLGRDSGTIPQFLRTASAEMQATTPGGLRDAG